MPKGEETVKSISIAKFQFLQESTIFFYDTIINDDFELKFYTMKPASQYETNLTL